MEEGAACILFSLRKISERLLFIVRDGWGHGKMRERIKQAIQMAVVVEIIRHIAEKIFFWKHWCNPLRKWETIVI